MYRGLISAIAGTPVKSCISTRAGMNAISREGSALGSQAARDLMSSAVTVRPSSWRSRFSSRMRREKEAAKDSTPGGLKRLQPEEADGGLAGGKEVAAERKESGCWVLVKSLARKVVALERAAAEDDFRWKGATRGDG